MPWRLGRDRAQPITKVNTTVSISTRNKTNINMTHDIKPPHTDLHDVVGELELFSVV